MVVDNDKCFACGSQNQQGLQLEFIYSPDGSRAETRFVPGPQFQGWQNIVHGGIISTLLDEVMAKAAAHQGYRVLTVELTTRFKSQARVMEPLHCKAVIESVKKKVVYAKGAVCMENGEVVATATAKMFITTG